MNFVKIRLFIFILIKNYIFASAYSSLIEGFPDLWNFAQLFKAVISKQ